MAGVHDMLCYYGHAHIFYRQQVSYKVIKIGKSRETCLTTDTHTYRRANQSSFKKPVAGARG